MDLLRGFNAVSVMTRLLLALLLGQYEYYMVTHAWAEIAASIGMRTDVTRFGAQVINDIGFLGAGTIIVTGHQEEKDLSVSFQ